MSGTGGNSASQPELSKLESYESELKNISLRKRKTPADEFSRQFSEFKQEILGILQDFTKTQTDGMNNIRYDISFIKEQLLDMRTTTNNLISENSNLKLLIENLTTNINDTQSEIKCLENDIQVLQKSQPSALLKPYQTPISGRDDIMAEVQERLSRSKNIIITGIYEPHMIDIQKRREIDRSEVKNVLQTIYPQCPEPDKILRLGKYDQNNKKIRPLKVCFLSTEIAKVILRKKTHMKDSKIKIYADQTPIQYQNMLNLREELKKRTENGETGLIIKYVKGNPKIIQQQSKN